MSHVAVPTVATQDAQSHPAADPLVPTVFHEPWWLDIVTRGQWLEAEVREDGRLIGRLPYQPARRYGHTRIGLPPLTHFLGPAVDEGAGSRQARWLKRASVTRELIRGLPRSAWFWQKFHRGVTDVVPFQAERFETAVQFTFEIDPEPEDVLWAALRDKHRNVIRKARERFSVQELRDSEEFAFFYDHNLEERGHAAWVQRDVMTNLLAAAVEHDAGKMLGLRDPHGNLAAAVFCPSDGHASYYMLSTRRGDSGNGAVPLLIWEAIRSAARSGRVFDFDGLSTDRAVGLYAGFGGRTSPRYVSARSPATRMMRLLRRGLRLNTNSFGA